MNMKNLGHQISLYLGQYRLFHGEDQQSEPQLPLKTAAAAGFLWLILVYSTTKGWVALSPVLWMDWLFFGAIPLSLIFSILYRSGWHRDRRLANRCGSLLMRSVALYGGLLLSIGFMTFLVAFFVMVFAAGEGPG
jgi:hypothetical protein